MPRSTTAFLLGTLIAFAPLAAQSCVSRSQQILQAAVQKARSGDDNQTRSLLQEAEAICSTSPIIKRRMAVIYRDILLDPSKADALTSEAQALEGKSSQAPQPFPKLGYVRDKWALVIGISRFKYLDQNQQLEAPANDARDFASVLLDPNIGRFRNDGQHVKLLTDEQATLQGVMSGVDYLSNHAQTDDLVVIYISSHGTSAHDDRYASGDAQTGYIVTYDTKLNALFSTSFATEELKRVLDHLRSQRIVVFLDTCFSGDSLRRFQGQNSSKALAEIEDDYLERVAQGTGRVLIVSSSGSQPSWEGSRNSLFTECLIGAMKQNNGMNSVSELFARLDHDLPYVVKREKNAEQTPMIWPQGQNLTIVIGTPIVVSPAEPTGAR